jgi:hypothetical protein
MKPTVRKIVKFIIAILSLFFPDNGTKKGDDPEGGKNAQN